MKLVFLLTVAWFIAAATGSEEDHVLVLNYSNFESIVSQGDIVVEFYAPWCGHCKKLAPEYEKAAKLLKDEKSPVRLAKCDVDNKQNKPLAEKYGVKGFPTIKLFRGGSLENPEEYKGQRTADGIVAEVKKAYGPASELITSKEQAAKLSQSEAVMLGAFGKEGKESKVYLEVAEKLRDEPFAIAHTFNSKLLEPCTADPEYCKGTLVFMLRGLDKNLSRYDGEFEVEALSAWAIKESTPRLAELLQSSPRHMKLVNTMFQKPDPRFLVYVQSEYEEKEKLKGILTEVDETDTSFNVLLIDGTINSKAARYFGLEEKDYPALVMHEHTEGSKYIRRKAGLEDIKPFIAEYKAGKLEPFVKSEEPPKDDSGPVKELVGKTFSDIFALGKDVFLEFHASWCGHCKKLAPIYDNLGKHFKDSEHVVIAKIDAAANDIPDKRFQIKGFPTLKYVKSSGEVLDYSGDRTLEDMIKFIDTTVASGADDPKAKEEEKTDTESKEEL